MVVSADLYESVKDAASHYGRHSSAGKCVEVIVTKQNSGVTMQTLTQAPAGDTSRPDVWSPAGSIWLDLVRQRATDSARELLPKKSPESIAVSPLVIAMPQPMAEQLGWGRDNFGWKDLINAAKDAPAFWKHHGKPDWGPLKLGKTNPAYSTSGLNSTIAAFYATAGTHTPLTPAAVTNADNQTSERNIEDAVVHYGDTTLTFMANLRHADDAASPAAALHYFSAATVEEATVVAYNLGYPCGTSSSEPGCSKRKSRPRTPLVAFYPQDGTLYSDHPYIKLNGLSSAKDAVADSFAAYLRSPGVQKQFAAIGYRTLNKKPTSLLTQPNGALRDAPLNPLPNPQPGALDKLLNIWPQLRKKANVLFLIDTSTSMDDPVAGTGGQSKMDLLQKASPQLFGSGYFANTDRVGMWEFNSGITSKVDVGSMSQNRRTLTETLKDFIPGGSTDLYQTVDSAVESLSSRYDSKAINAIVVLTDGKNDPRNDKAKNNLIENLKTHSPAIRVFTIAYGNDADKTVLQQMADASGAHAYDAKDATTIRNVLVDVISNF
ncbi:substrate-binding domain-containing protein [Streptomyces hirsutus]|uniref:vWA domain-containing protein n=1 Tax=Streptomyces hirsutus TaxID=35620 RepID=UPI0033D1AD06